MVFKCCVPFCENHSYTPNMSLHNFTKDAKLRKIWIHKIRRDTVKSKRNPKPFTVSQYTKICSAHFERDDFLIRSEKTRLKPTAIPSIFSWNNESIRRRKSQTLLSGTSCSETLNNVTHAQKISENVSGDVLLSEQPEFLHADEEAQEPTVNTSIFTEKKSVLHAEEEAQECTVNTSISTEDKSVLHADHAAEDAQERTVSTSISTEDKSVINPENNDNLECTRFRKLYTDLLVSHQEFLKNCKCHKVKVSHKAVHVDMTNIAVCGGSFFYKDITCNEPMFTLSKFKESDNEIFYYTGFTDFTVLQICLNMLFEYGNENLIKMRYINSKPNRNRHRRLSREDEFFLVLIKLRQNFGYEHLSKLFDICVATVSNIFVSWINFIYVRLGSLDIWAHRDVIFSYANEEFKENYPNVIGSLDATEIYIQTPSSLSLQTQTYSNYKHNNTAKGLVVIDCNGSVIFVSALFTGSISDNELLHKSCFKKMVESKLNKGFLLHGDTFLADKGFTASELLKPVDITVPVFRINNMQFSVNEVHHTQKIAHERVHVERAIGRIKNYKILSSEYPLTAFGSLNQVWTVCCLLSNFQRALRQSKP